MDVTRTKNTHLPEIVADTLLSARSRTSSLKKPSWGTVPHPQQSGDGSQNPGTTSAYHESLHLRTVYLPMLMLNAYQSHHAVALLCLSAFWVGWVGTDMWCMLHPMVNAVDRNSGAVLVLLGLLPPVMLKARKPAHSYMVKGKLAVAPLPASIFHKVTCIPPSAAAVLGRPIPRTFTAGCVTAVWCLLQTVPSALFKTWQATVPSCQFSTLQAWHAA